MKENLKLRVIVSAVALTIAAVHIFQPDAKIDSITLVLLIVCALPWLQPLIKTVELLGVKLELQDLQNKVAEAKGAAESASQQAGLALSATTPQQKSGVPAASPTTKSDIETLATQYQTIRDTQRSGDARTAAMTDVVPRMIDLAPRVDSSFNLTEALRDQKSASGIRLFGYIYLYARPDSSFLSELVDSVREKEDKPFGQYWGLQSIGRVMSTVQDVPKDIRTKLQAFALKLPRGTDREYEVNKLLRQSS
jgi:hypothetical protein